MTDDRRRKTTHGFTLMEILVAVVILGMAYVTVLQNFSVSMRNITRLADSRTQVFENLLGFETTLRSLDEEGTADSGRPTFLDGRTYQLVLIANDTEEFMTLKLEKIQ